MKLLKKILEKLNEEPDHIHPRFNLFPNWFINIFSWIITIGFYVLIAKWLIGLL